MAISNTMTSETVELDLLLFAIDVLGSCFPIAKEVSQEGEECFLFFPTPLGWDGVIAGISGCLPDSGDNCSSMANTIEGKRKTIYSDHQDRNSKVVAKNLA